MDQNNEKHVRKEAEPIDDMSAAQAAGGSPEAQSFHYRSFCAGCGAKYEEWIDKCPACGSTSILTMPYKPQR